MVAALLYASLAANVALLTALATIVAFVHPADISANRIRATSGRRRLESNSLWELYFDVFKDAKFIDLTHAFSPEIPAWVGSNAPKFSASAAQSDFEAFVAEGEPFTYAQHGFQEDDIHFSTFKIGTQLNPPAGWNEFGATISDLPATMALRPLIVIDLSAECEKAANCVADIRHVKAYERRNRRIPRGAVVFFRTGWAKRWENYKADGAPETFPSVSLEVLKFLHEERHILFHGHEPLDTDMTPTLEAEAWLMHNNYAQAEGIANLDQVAETGCLLCTGFAKPDGGLGGLAHFVAVCPRDHEHGVTVKDAPGAPLPKQKHPLRRGKDGVMRPDPHAAPLNYCNEGGHPLGCNLQTKKFAWIESEVEKTE
eukprot:GEMP01027734.1.p1 GENE.GEMP01027734.1~~GEMP01027734.1.p1  ORF type:complete len:370 (+),score=79.21 GEMP01027734.1:289-1398(+)